MSPCTVSYINIWPSIATVIITNSNLLQVEQAVTYMNTGIFIFLKYGINLQYLKTHHTLLFWRIPISRVQKYTNREVSQCALVCDLLRATTGNTHNYKGTLQGREAADRLRSNVKR